jgi:hypothetical protein
MRLKSRFLASGSGAGTGIGKEVFVIINRLNFVTVGREAYLY